MKIAYFDLIAGASGDMILGALLDAGLPLQALQAELEALGLDDFSLQAQRVLKNGFRATKVDVLVRQDVPERHLAEIEAIITQSELPLPTQEKALAMFRKLGQIEAHIHDKPLEQVHLHELGGVDTIVDVVGTLCGLVLLGVEKVYASPLPLGRGFVKGAHGQIPLPAPATSALLKGVPVTSSPVDIETVTPTGALLLTSLVSAFRSFPSMRVEAIGYGAGTLDLPIPNLLRVFIGEETLSPFSTGPLILLETNIDDMNPEFYSHIMERLFEAGALDVYLTPIQMKKNRPGVLLSVLCEEQATARAREILFLETTTLGVRELAIQRSTLQRQVLTVETPYGAVRVKVARLPDGKTRSAPEYEDCRRLARETGVPLQEIYRAAESSAGSLDRS